MDKKLNLLHKNFKVKNLYQLL